MTYVLNIYYCSGRHKTYHLNITDEAAAQLVGDFSHKLYHTLQFNNVTTVINLEKIEELILSKV